MLIEDLIKKYRSNRLSPEEVTEMLHLLNSLPADEVERAMNAVAEDDGFPKDAEVTEEMIERVKKMLDMQIMADTANPTFAAIQNEDAETSVDEPEEHLLDHTRKWKILSTAAMIIGLLAIGFSVFSTYKAHSILSDYSFAEISTGFGEKSTLTLPDGTTVRLAGRTTLRYPSDLALGNRNIEFDGEAYFDVAKDKNHPFKIKGNGITVEVKGTSFNLYSRNNSETSEVILDSGNVKIVADNGHNIDLSAGESAIFNKETGTFDIVTFQSNPMIRKRIFGIRYENISPEELIKALEDRFDIVLNEEIVKSINSPFTGVLPDDDINETIAILSRIYGFNVPYDKEKLKAGE